MGTWLKMINILCADRQTSWPLGARRRGRSSTSKSGRTSRRTTVDYRYNQWCIKFLIPPGGGSLSSLFGKNIKLWIGEENIMAAENNITRKKGRGEAISSSLSYWGCWEEYQVWKKKIGKQTKIKKMGEEEYKVVWTLIHSWVKWPTCKRTNGKSNFKNISEILALLKF